MPKECKISAINIITKWKEYKSYPDQSYPGQGNNQNNPQNYPNQGNNQSHPS
jgi:hypothetical protein